MLDMNKQKKQLVSSILNLYNLNREVCGVIGFEFPANFNLASLEDTDLQEIKNNLVLINEDRKLNQAKYDELNQRLQIAGYIDNSTLSKIHDGSHIVVRKFYNDYKNHLPSDFLDRYGHDYIVSLSFCIETEKFEKADGTITIRKVLVGNEKEVVTGLQSEWRSGFKSFNRFHVLSGTVKTWTFVFGNFLEKSEHMLTEFITTPAYISQKRAEEKTQKRIKTKSFAIKREKPQYGRLSNPKKLVADYKVRGAKFRHKWGTKPLSETKLFRGSGKSAELRLASAWKKSNKLDSKKHIVHYRIVGQDNLIYVEYDRDNIPSLCLGKMIKLSDDCVTVIPTIPLTVGSQEWRLFQEILEWLGLGSKTVSHSSRKLERRNLIRPTEAQIEFSYRKEVRQEYQKTNNERVRQVNGVKAIKRRDIERRQLERHTYLEVECAKATETKMRGMRLF